MEYILNELFSTHLLNNRIGRIYIFAKTMYINGIAHYIPEERISNDYFLKVNGLDDEWIFQRTGIKTGSKAAMLLYYILQTGV